MTLNYKNGFTMVEQLLTLMIILMILPIVQLLTIYLYTPKNQYMPQLNDATNAIFQMITAGYEASVVNNTLKFKNHKNQTVLIERYNDQIRRRVGGEGHEIILRDIQNLNFSMEKNLLTIEIIMVNNERIKKIIRIV